jgi:hypothetical protein
MADDRHPSQLLAQKGARQLPAQLRESPMLMSASYDFADLEAAGWLTARSRRDCGGCWNLQFRQDGPSIRSLLLAVF